ncbi:MAG: TAXI family TRAP transporter solute-binding subunit [Rhodospirillaceae bacterium]
MNGKCSGPFIVFRVLSAAVAVIFGLTLAIECARAAPPVEPGLHYFRIATGTSSGTYFTVGTLIANAISNPPGSRPCERGGSCGVPGVIASAQATSGGIDNLLLLRSGAIEAALVQADLAALAYRGQSVYKRDPPFETLRALAALYTETVQIVVRADSSIRSVPDLHGRTVSIGEPGSATGLEAGIILGTLGLPERGFKPVHLQPGASVDALVEGKLDALFILGGAPFTAIADAANRLPIRLLPISPDDAPALQRGRWRLSHAVVPAGVYTGVPETATLGIAALLVVRAELEEPFVYNLTRALWHPATRKALESGFPKGSFLTLDAARDAGAVPLHPGAERFYQEALKPPEALK